MQFETPDVESFPLQLESMQVSMTPPRDRSLKRHAPSIAYLLLFNSSKHTLIRSVINGAIEQVARH